MPEKPPFHLPSCWPPELRLVAAAAVRDFDAAARRRCEALLSAPLDWEKVLSLAEAHALTPVVAHNVGPLGGVPAEVAAHLRSALEVNTRKSLHLARELARVSAALRSGGVQAVAYKGPVLAHLLYGSLGLRRFADLDLLVDRAERERAAAVLIDCGYARYRNIADKRRQERGDCEEQFVRQDDTTIDLHWEIVQPYLSVGPLPGGWKARTRELQLAGATVRTFGAREQLLVLALHGGKHRWERLSWLADLSAAIALGGFDWSEVLTAAGEMRIRYHLLLGVTLAHYCFDAAVPESVLHAAHDAGVPWAYATRIADSLGESTTPLLRTRWRYQLRMRERLSDRLRAAARFALRPGSVDLDEHSPQHALLYPVVRAARVASRAFRAGAGAEHR